MSHGTSVTVEVPFADAVSRIRAALQAQGFLLRDAGHDLTSVGRRDRCRLSSCNEGIRRGCTRLAASRRLTLNPHTMWLLKRYGLPCLHWYVILRGRAWPGVS